jgi:hypothetical protein
VFLLQAVACLHLLLRGSTRSPSMPLCFHQQNYTTTGKQQPQGLPS